MGPPRQRGGPIVAFSERQIHPSNHHMGDIMNNSDTGDMTAMVKGYMVAAAWLARSLDDEESEGEQLTAVMHKPQYLVDDSFTNRELVTLFGLDTLIEIFSECYMFCQGVEDDADSEEGVWQEQDARRFAKHELLRMDPGQAGHDFYLSRNGHGAGFFDRGLGWAGDALQKATKPYGETNHILTWEGRDYYS